MRVVTDRSLQFQITYQQVVGREMLPAFADVLVIAALDVWASGAVGDDGRVERPPQLRE